MSDYSGIERVLAAYLSVVKSGGGDVAVPIASAVCGVLALHFGMQPEQTLQFTALPILGYLAPRLLSLSLERRALKEQSAMNKQKSEALLERYEERQRASAQQRTSAADGAEVKK
jgi:hypothetical protein